jgi:hypothetical protein
MLHDIQESKKGESEKETSRDKMKQLTDLNYSISIVSLDVHFLNIPIKRLSEVLKIH